MSSYGVCIRTREQNKNNSHEEVPRWKEKKSVAAIAISVSAISIFALKIPEEINKSYADPPIRLSSGDDVL